MVTRGSQWVPRGCQGFLGIPRVPMNDVLDVSLSAAVRLAWPPRSPRQAPRAVATSCSRRARSSTRSCTIRRRWCSSRRRSCSRSAAAVREPVREADAAGGAAVLPARSPTPSGLDVHFGEPVDDGRAAGGRGDSRSRRSRRHGPAVPRVARSVVLARGAYDMPNRLGVPGEDLPHVSHYYREPHPYYRRRVVIVGGKNSAAEAALDILPQRRAKCGSSTAAPRWASRSSTGSSPTSRIASRKARFAARFDTRVVEITPADVVLDGPDGRVRERGGRTCCC